MRISRRSKERRVGTERPERGQELAPALSVAGTANGWRADPTAALKRTLIGPPRATRELGRTLLSKKLALPIFASDPLSSVAYATEAALVVLVGAAASAGHLVLPISGAIAALMAIVVLSYTQTVQAYETSGGAYIVAKENLGRLPSLVAGAALLVDYVLTVAVSVTAGVLALTSAAPSLEAHKVEISLVFVGALTVVNLRGVREAGMLFALPTYSFIAVMLAMVATGVGKCAVGACPAAQVPDPVPAGTGGLGVLLLLGAFASGAAALTGVESTSNGVGAFRPPRGRNAALTLLVMGAIAITLLLGVSYLAVVMDARPSESVSLVSEIARATFPASSPTSPLYYAVQALTFGILVLAANTSYQGFPRLAAALARDRFFPRQFVNLGDRLVYSNGIIVLAGVASALIWVFHADVIALIHLYVIGVFTAFTLSQAGMVRHWLRLRGPSWRRRAIVNGVGAAATGVVTLLVIEAKFTAGAWLVIVAIPLLISLSLLVHRHYRSVGRRLRAEALAVRSAPEAKNTTVLYVESLDEATHLAAWYAGRIGGESYRPVAVRNGRPPVSPARWRSPCRRSAPRGPGARGRRRRRGAGLRLGTSARGVELRHRRRPGALPQALARRGRPPAHQVLAQAAPALGSRRRHLQRPGCRGRAASAAVPLRDAGARLGSARSLPAGDQLRPDARSVRHEGRLLRLRASRSQGRWPWLGACRRRGAARGGRGSLPRPGRAAPPLPAADHRRP